MQLFINHVNIIIISRNYMPTYDYKCVLLITYNPANISKYTLHMQFLILHPQFSSLGSAQFSLSDFIVFKVNSH